ncbi:NACHT domain-containing protein [Xanthomonas sp. LMG 12459]|uniref:NACHT domain-containing protein n=1 Tax=Xanthomonas sp. LMG 12459 TaxID=1591131 RepID=UPI001262E8A0|nr:NACHT domain-containing protein [Xanthomonas sp. LMG 12459]KAB7776730.1 hypothetical protein CEK65_13195 [Xanthomonas sp. LMG 12459]
MSVDALAVGAGKVAATWMSGLLKAWSDKRKTSVADERAWKEVASAIVAQTTVLARRHSRVTTVAFPREAVDIASIYIPLTLESKGKREGVVVESFPTKIFSKTKKILIVDVAGMGKSTISKVIYLKSLEEKRFLPLLIDLRRLTDKIGVEDLILSQFGIKFSNLDILREFLRTQPLLFIFDGFDEVSDKNKLWVARGVRDFIDRAPSSNFLITSRPELPFGEYADFTVFQIKELTKVEASQLITKYGQAFGIEERARALLEELKARHDESVSSFLKNPLLTSLLFRAFEFKSVVPVKRGVFYRQVFDALYEAHDLSKETGYVREKRTGLHHDDFHRAVRALAKLFRQSGEVEISIDKFMDMAKKISSSLCPDLTFGPEDFLHDVLNSVPIFLKDGVRVRWAHKSLLDYFLCEFLLRDYPESKEAAIYSSAFGVRAPSNFNFLILVNEADPILFAKSVTIPALDKLLERYATYSEAIPSSIEPDLREDIIEFLVCYECVTTKSTAGRIPLSDDFEESLNTRYGIKGFVPRFILHFNANKEFYILKHEAAVALDVPVKFGTIASKSIRELRHNYGRDKNPDFGIVAGPHGVFSERKSKSDWDGVEDELGRIVSFLEAHDFRLFDKNSLRKAKFEIQSLVDSSMRARSEIF